MVKHWKSHGIPTYMAVSGYLGLVKPTGRGTSDAKNYGNLDELAAMFGDSGGMIQ